MITSVSFKNFRRFSELELPLSQITMLTGSNGVGKTSVLEGLYCLFSETKLDVAPLSRYSKALGVTVTPVPNMPHMPPILSYRENTNYRLFWAECPFFGHQECSIDASSNSGDNWEWTYQKVGMQELDEPFKAVYPPIESTAELALWNWHRRGKSKEDHSAHIQRVQNLSLGDGLFILSPGKPQEISHWGLCRYLEFPTLRITANILTHQFSKTLTEALQIINPLITDVRLTDRVGTLSVILEGKHSVSLGAIGNGAVTLVSALFIIDNLIENARQLPADTPVFILIDEIGAGIHYSIMSEIWQYIQKLMKRSPNIQFVFTTHNDDCLRAFCEEFIDSDVAKIVRLHQIKSNNSIVPTVYEKEKFGNIVEGNWEVRG